MELIFQKYISGVGEFASAFASAFATLFRGDLLWTLAAERATERNIVQKSASTAM